MIEIVSRDKLDYGTTTWIVTQDSSGLGLTDCGCGKEQEKRIVQSRGANVIEVIFYHDAAPGVAWTPTRCMMAFLRPKFDPLTYDGYVAQFPVVDGDEAVDGDDGTL